MTGIFLFRQSGSASKINRAKLKTSNAIANLSRIKHFLFTVVAITLAVTDYSLAQSVPVKKLIDFETQANGAGIRSNEGVPMPHYEIPLKFLKQQREVNLSNSIYNSLVFEKNGERYVRWVINPEDTRWHQDVEAFLSKNKLPIVKGSYFTGFQTASRSYIVVDPTNGAEFSIKSSTNITGGDWRDKKQEFEDGFDIMLVSDLLKRIQARESFKYVIIMQEPLTFGIKDIDQSIVVRELAGLSKAKDRFYLPGFSALHEQVGREIASKNGSDNPAQFWKDNYAIPLARAAAELTAKTGIWYDSPHSQNFLIELDSNLRPTGKIVLRDLGDVYLNRPILKALGEEKILNKFSDTSNIKDHLNIAFGPLHGNNAPSWMSKKSYNEWFESFSSEFRTKYSEMTGIHSVTPGSMSMYSYFNVDVDFSNKEFSSYLSQMKQAPKWCSQLF